MPSIKLTIRDKSNILETVAFNTKDKTVTRIQATKPANYELYSDKFNEAPNHIVTKRVGNDLEVSFSSTDPQADLIIEGYFDYPESYLIGQAADQSYYYYIPDTGEVGDYVSILQADAVSGHALGGEGFATPWWASSTTIFDIFSGLSDLEFNPLWLLAGGLVGGSLIFSGGDTATTGTQKPQSQVDNDTVQLDEIKETTVNVLNNDDGGFASATVTFTDGSTTKVVDGQGVWTVNDGSVEGKPKGSITFVPDTNLKGDPTIEYILNGDQSLKATVTIDYPDVAVKPEPNTPDPEPNTPNPEPNKPNPEPQKPPVTADDSGKGELGQPVTVSVLGNDSDSDSSIDPTTVKIVGAGKALAVAGEGIWLVDGKTGDITFEPERGFLGDPTPIQYTVKDAEGNLSNPSKVTIDYPQVTSQLTVMKEARVDDGAKVGSVIHYTFTIKNTGNVALTDLTINDPTLDTLNINQTALKAGETITVTATHTLTKADFEAGKVENVATITAKDPTGKVVSDGNDEAGKTKPIIQQ